MSNSESRTSSGCWPADTAAPDYSPDLQQSLEAQVPDWRNHPFDPHRIASYRTVAYQKTVVMKYLDNLIAWGDNLFRQDSMESINEATQYYLLAAEFRAEADEGAASGQAPAGNLQRVGGLAR